MVGCMNTPDSLLSSSRLLLKGLLLFLIFNLLFAVGNPLPGIGRVSLYNRLFPGRVRLPYGEKPQEAYNLSLFSLEAMFAAHEIAAPKQKDEFRVALIGDSSVWGFLLEPGQTLSAQLNRFGLSAPDGRRLRFYNLGYPTMSLSKDLLILSQALAYQPDLILWLFTLESFPLEKQLESPIVQHNPQIMGELIATYSLPLDPTDKAFAFLSFWDRTLIGQRRALADILRLQIYGILWAATGVDQAYPEEYPSPQEDLPNDLTFHNLQPPMLYPKDLALAILAAGSEIAGDVPIIFVNEPMYISHGQNSHIRYNFFYPRWAYDQYRTLLEQNCQANGWTCLDLWNLVDPTEFTNSAIHLSPAGEKRLSEAIQQTLVEWLEAK